MFTYFLALMPTRSHAKYCIVNMETTPAPYPRGQLLVTKARTALVQTPLAISLKYIRNALHQLII